VDLRLGVGPLSGAGFAFRDAPRPVAAQARPEVASLLM
jgi:hypothetical protein